MNLFPTFLTQHRPQGTLLAQQAPGGQSPNLSTRAQTYLGSIGASAEGLFHHAVAVLHAPSYRAENLAALRQDWPRIPLPQSKEALEASAALGKQIASLFDVETPAQTTQEHYLQVIAAFKLVEKAPIDESKHFALTAGWGHAGKGGVTMPGRGKSTERDYTPEERRSMGDAAIALLGDRTLDVYLNDAAYWANIPVRVWDYTIGGYHVVKKWLSYREEKLLGRPLTKDEVRYVQDMARRIASILLLESALNENYLNVKRHCDIW